uniref:Uncharacterized protein n=1 Tax=Anguilla anguilla TaxID=7936 RepID=A0A0E9PAR0_ANGAN
MQSYFPMMTLLLFVTQSSH